MNRAKLISMTGALLASAGAVVVLFCGRVLVTFFLDLVVLFLGVDDLPPTYDFPWGTMTWGSSLGDLFTTAIGLGLLLLGITLMSPALVSRIPDVTGWRRVLGLVAATMFLVMALGIANTAMNIASAFGAMTIAGAADPSMLGESLPVTVWGGMRILILLGILALGLVAVASDSCVTHEVSRVGKIQTKIAIGMLFLFSLCLITLCLGPASSAFTLIKAPEVTDPAELAKNITFSVYLMGFSALFSAIAGIMLLLPGLTKRKQAP